MLTLPEPNEQIDHYSLVFDDDSPAIYGWSLKLRVRMKDNSLIIFYEDSDTLAENLEELNQVQKHIVVRVQYFLLTKEMLEQLRGWEEEGKIKLTAPYGSIDAYTAILTYFPVEKSLPDQFMDRALRMGRKIQAWYGCTARAAGMQAAEHLLYKAAMNRGFDYDDLLTEWEESEYSNLPTHDYDEIEYDICHKVSDRLSEEGR